MRPALAAGLGLAAGLAIGLLLGRGALAPREADRPLARVLERELESEREQGDTLRDRVEELEARLAAAPAPPVLPGELGGEVTASAEADDPSADTADGREGQSAAEEGDAAGPSGGFDDARLLALGFHPADVERLRHAWESLELERLYLQNERARSTHRDGSHWLKMRELENATLEELGEAEFDALLYAAGDRNRVTVTRVFPESPAESAGYLEGDQITAYDGKPIYRMHALKNETTRCELGTSVSVTVLRDGSERRIWTPCGPLGVQLEMVNAPPR